jgi:hypothetical protein
MYSRYRQRELVYFPLLSICFHADSFLDLFFDPEEGGDMFLRKVGWLSNGLHGVIYQKMALFISTAVRT